jgi:hypothetical protein
MGSKLAISSFISADPGCCVPNASDNNPRIVHVRKKPPKLFLDT